MAQRIPEYFSDLVDDRPPLNPSALAELGGFCVAGSGYLVNGLPDAATQTLIEQRVVQGWPRESVYWNCLGTKDEDDSLNGTLIPDPLASVCLLAAGGLVGIVPADALASVAALGNAALVGVLMTDPLAGSSSLTEGGLAAVMVLSPDSLTGASVLGEAGLIGVLDPDSLVAVSVLAEGALTDVGALAADSLIGSSVLDEGVLIGVLAPDSLIAVSALAEGGLADIADIVADALSGFSVLAEGGLVGIVAADSATGSSALSETTLEGVMAPDALAAQSAVDEGGLIGVISGDALAGSSQMDAGQLVGVLAPASLQGTAAVASAALTGVIAADALVGTSVLSAGALTAAATTLSVTDNFNRANGGLGTNWETYTPLPGGTAPSIDNNKFSAYDDAAATWKVAPGPDQYAQVDIWECTNWGGLMVRADPNSYTLYYGKLVQRIDSDFSFLLALGKVVNGAYTGFDEVDVSIWGAGFCTDGEGGETDQATCELNGGWWSVPVSHNIQKLRLRAVGTTISLDSYDVAAWTTRLTHTDSSIASGRIGIQASSTTLDNFQGGDL